jgi:hypothetical protein
VQHGIAVTIVKLAVLALGLRNDLELLDAPDKESRMLTKLFPGWLGGSRIVLDLVVNITAGELDIAALNVILLGMNQASVGCHVCFE